MKTINILMLALLSMQLWGCSKNPVSPATRELTVLEKRLVESDNRFGFKLFKEITQAEGEKNIFISPLSISMALGMTLNGAANETESAMTATLEFANMTGEEINQTYKTLIDLLVRMDSQVVLTIANSIWYRQGLAIAPDFVDKNQNYFAAEVNPLDFAAPNAVNTINDWVKRSTRNRIEEIVDEIKPEHVMFLINAIYFKGNWRSKFDPEMTKPDSFQLSDGSKIPIDLMQQEHEYSYLETDLFQFVDLPYGNAGFSMAVILPQKDVALDTVMGILNHDKWNTWKADLSQQLVTLSLPRFQIEYDISLKAILSKLGMGVAFLPGQADFSRMTTEPVDLYIDKVKHKTFLEINEEGTEAAAVTSVEIGTTSVPLSYRVVVNHPFLLIIHDTHSGAILFMGKITHPAE